MVDITDITQVIVNRAVAKSLNPPNSQSLHLFRQNNPVLEQFVYGGCHTLGGSFTKENWREIWSTAICLCYQVRQKKYILSAETFDIGNMIVIDDNCLRFHKLFGSKMVNKKCLDDFKAVANFISASFTSKNQIPIDVDFLLDQLRSNDLKACPITDNYITLITCNYALMSDTSRRSFLIDVWQSALVEKSCERSILTWVAKRCAADPPVQWDKEPSIGLCTPLGDILYNGKFNGLSEAEVFKFIRHSLVHLVTDKHYSPELALMIITCCYRKLILHLQPHLFQKRYWDEKRWYAYKPAAR